MSLTRSLLKAMELADPQIEQIIQAHASTVDALKTQLAQAQADAENDHALLMAEIARLTQQAHNAAAIQAEFDAYRAEVETAEARKEAQRLIHEALIHAGANEKAVTLLAREIDPAAVQVENGKLVNADALVAPVKEKYPDFFSQEVRKPAQVIQPPKSLHGVLTRQDVSRMSPEEINRNWPAVRTALSGR